MEKGREGGGREAAQRKRASRHEREGGRGGDGGVSMVGDLCLDAVLLLGLLPGPAVRESV